MLGGLAALAAAALAAGQAAGTEQASGKDIKLPFDIEAHRGGRALFPENTLVSFANALSMGVTTLELDIGMTRDGAIVVSHERGLNPDLARGADGKYVAQPGSPLIQLSLDEVKQYDVGQIRPGSIYAAQFHDQHAVPGTKIPTLIELIDLVRRSGDSQVRLNIETKIDPNHPDESPPPERFVALLLELLRAEKFEDRVMVQSFDWRTLQLVQQRAPGIPTVYLTLQAGKDPTVSLEGGMAVQLVAFVALARVYTISGPFRSSVFAVMLASAVVALPLAWHGMLTYPFQDMDQAFINALRSPGKNLTGTGFAGQ